MTAPERLSVVLRDGLALVRRFVRARPGAFALAVGGATVFASAIVLAAVVVGRVTDDLIIPVLDGEAALGSRWVGGVLLITGVAVYKAAGITLRRTFAGWLQGRTQADLRYQLIDHQMRLRLAWFRRQSTGDLMAVSETDGRQATYILAPLPFGTGSLLLLLASIGIISWIDSLLGGITLVGLGGIIAIDLRGSWRTFEAFQAVQHSRGLVSGIAHESFDGALTVKALGREEYETERLARASEKLRDDIIEVNRLWAFYGAFIESFPAVGTVVLLMVGALRLKGGSLTAGELVTVTYLLSLLAIPMRLMGWVFWDLAHSLAGWRRVDTVLSERDFLVHGDLAADPQPTGAAVEGAAVGFAYSPGEVILSGVELEIPPSRTVAVVGPTGSGKSTLAMLLVRLWDPDSGAITLDGRDLRRFARAELPREVAFVPQEAFLFNEDVRGNITLGMPLPEEQIEAALRLAAADEFVAALPQGMGTQLGERGTTLSGGQRQRVALARALARRPRLLVLDDATSAVDPSVEADILRGLREADLPSTVVVVAYRPSSIALADTVIYLDGGRVVAHGRHGELLATEPGYARLLQAYEEDAAARQAERGRGTEGGAS
ncbi:MAG: ABC transporter ATP-binding protein [Acidimicrobiia bacterium]|nr:ABC transporter ATP-binding protein [Acidimicrobiia bacterium]